MTTPSSIARRIGGSLAAASIFAALVLAAEFNFGSSLRAQSPSTMSAKSVVSFTADGQLLPPKGYREWIYVGTPLTPNDMNDGNASFPEFHNVYINPAAYKHYERTGEFPDGAVVVKELISVGTKKASSGQGYFMGDFIGLEVSIKDKTRFRNEPGNWAYFSFGHSYPLEDRAAAQPTTSCNSCHRNADDDFVFTQYYPVLRAAKGPSKTD